MKQQIHAYYTGRVQGVGFRFTVVELARNLGVTGWTKNLADGRVEVVAEAEEQILIDFLNQLSQSFKNHIQDTDVQWQPASGEFRDFGVEF